MSHPGDIRTVWGGLSTPGRAAAAVCAAAGVVLLIPLWSLVSAVIGPRPSLPKQEAESAAEQRAEQYEVYVAQVDGRSLFHLPAAPGSGTSAPPPPPGPPAPPPPPSSYGGPAIIAMINGEVWFNDGRKLKVGDGPKDDLAVRSVNAPWDAQLLWKGVEFKVSLFTREDLVFRDKGTTPESKREPAAEPQPDAKAEGKPDAPPATKPEDAAPPKEGDKKPGSPAPAEPSPGTAPPEAPKSPPGGPGLLGG